MVHVTMIIDGKEDGIPINILHPPPSSSSSSSPSSRRVLLAAETPWTDAQIRWSDEEEGASKTKNNQWTEKGGNDSDDDDEHNDAFFDPFADPDPTQIFHFSFAIPNVSLPAASLLSDSNSKSTQKGNDSAVATSTAINATDIVELKIQGYKTHSDEVWQSTGLTLWKASKYLCDYMVENADQLQGKRILELGAGLGLNGILAHRIAPQRSTVDITDGDTDALVQLRHNIQTNKVNNNISAVQLLWGRKTAEAFLEHRQSDSYHSRCGDGRFDVILASDIIYAKVVIDPLWETIRTLLTQNGGSFWMAFARRRVPVTIEFVLQKAREHGFRYRLAAESECAEDGSDDDADEVDKNTKFEDAAGADQVFIYVFEWEDDPSTSEVCTDQKSQGYDARSNSSVAAQSISSSHESNDVKDDAKDLAKGGFQRGFLLNKNGSKEESPKILPVDVSKKTKESRPSKQEGKKKKSASSSGWTKGFLTTKAKTPEQPKQDVRSFQRAKDLLLMENLPAPCNGNTTAKLHPISGKVPLIELANNENTATEGIIEPALIVQTDSDKNEGNEDFPLFGEVCTMRHIVKGDNGAPDGVHLPCQSDVKLRDSDGSILDFQRDLEGFLRDSRANQRTSKQFAEISSTWSDREARCAWEFVLINHDKSSSGGIKTLGVILVHQHLTALSYFFEKTETSEDRLLCLRAVEFLKELPTSDLIHVSSGKSFSLVLKALLEIALSKRRSVLAQSAWEVSVILISHLLQNRPCGSEEGNGETQWLLELRHAELLLNQQLQWQLSKKSRRQQKIDKVKAILSKIQMVLVAQDGELEMLQLIAADLASLGREI